MRKNLHLLCLTVLIVLSLNSRVSAQKIYVLTNNDMFYWMDAANPSNMSSPVAIMGISPGTELVGMDVRPATGQLYVLGYNSTMQKTQLYTLDTASKTLNAIGQGISSFMLSGRVGFDFNPTVDRIRVISSDEHDYRLHPVTGALVATDGALMYAMNDVNAGKNPNIGSGAYTNSYIGATSTTLYNYDDSLNVLTIQNPPNNGIQNTVGSSGIMLNLSDASSDLDIYFDPSSMMNKAYFVANTGMSNTDSLYSINLSTGAAVAISNLNMSVKDIAVMIDRTPRMLNGNDFYALSSNNNLLKFNSEDPSFIISAMPVTGVQAGQTLVGMDMRAVDLKIYAIGYNATSMVARVYTIDPATAMATPVSMDSISNIDLSGNVGVDFNPVADRIRVVTSNNKNYRINQLTGLLAATDSTLRYKTGDVNFGTDPDVATVAYTNSKVGASSTLLYAYDDALHALLTQNPPNDGILNTIGASGIMVNTMDKTSDMDIYFDHATQMNMAYFSANTIGANDKLYSLNVNTGAVTEIGSIGMGIAIKDIVVRLDSTPLVSAVSSAKNNALQFNAYPNPVQSDLTIAYTLLEDGDVDITIIDLMGKVILNASNVKSKIGENKLQLNLQEVEKGVYFIELESRGHKEVLKFIK